MHPCSPTSMFCFVLAFLFLGQTEALAQSQKKKDIADWIGPLVGINQALFYPKDINKNPIKGGNPTLIPDVMYGLSYHHTFSRRWSHIFQFRITNNQMKYWNSSKQTWHVGGERITVKSDTGLYHQQYTAASMNYMFGWAPSKKINWSIYAGVQISSTIADNTTKTVDGLENGKLNGFDYIPYPETLYFFDKTVKTFSQGNEGEILFRTDYGIAFGKKWMLRPALEFGIITGKSQVYINRHVAFYVEVYKAL